MHYFYPLPLLALSWLIRHNFRPLNDFKSELARRKAQDLNPIHNVGLSS